MGFKWPETNISNSRDHLWGMGPFSGTMLRLSQCKHTSHCFAQRRHYVKYVEKVQYISYGVSFVIWKSIHTFYFRLDKWLTASYFMITECHHQGTGKSADSTAAPVPSAVRLCLRAMFVSAVCRRSSHVTFIHQSGPSISGDTKIGMVCPAAERQKWFSSDISVVLQVWRFSNGSK